ncbi:hypothetical protein [Streptomyces roseolus]|uniref:hypothetical protein n=1 Tax=Streptomyces roseolus TaxID=67358 RepID=UPI0037A76D3F
MRSMTRIVSRLTAAAALAVLAVGAAVVVHGQPDPQAVVSAEPDWGAPTAATLTGPATPEEPDWD